MPTHSSSLQTRTRRSAGSSAIGNSRPLLVWMSGTANTNSTPLCLMAARRLGPWSSASAGLVAVRASICSFPPEMGLRVYCVLGTKANAKLASAATASRTLLSPRSPTAGQLAVLVLKLEWSELLHRLFNVAGVHQPLG